MTTEAGGGDGGEGQQKVVYRVPTPAFPAPPTLRERVLTEDRKRNTVYYNIHPAAAAGNGHFISDPKEQRHVGGREYSRAQPVRNTWRFNTQRRRAGGGEVVKQRRAQRDRQRLHPQVQEMNGPNKNGNAGDQTKYLARE